MSSQSLKLKSVVGAIVCGILVSLATGIIENSLGASIIGARYYGYPLVWRVTMTLQPDEFRFVDLAIDVLCWTIISFLAFIVLRRILRKTSMLLETTSGAASIT